MQGIIPLVDMVVHVCLNSVLEAMTGSSRAQAGPFQTRRRHPFRFHPPLPDQVGLLNSLGVLLEYFFLAFRTRKFMRQKDFTTGRGQRVQGAGSGGKNLVGWFQQGVEVLDVRLNFLS